MGVNVKIDGIMVVAGLVAVVGLAVYIQRNKLITAFNPTSSNNLAYQAANSVTQTLTQGHDKTLGNFWYRKCKEQNFAPWYCPAVR